jgi:ribosomal protein L29
MSHKKTQDLFPLNDQELKVKVDGWRRELFGLRLNSVAAHVKDFSQFKKLRKNIARGLTILTQKIS